MAKIELNSLQKSFGKTEVIRGIDLEVPDGSFTVFVGPSGCGKSTLLRMLAGLETITSGDLLIDGVRVNDADPITRGVAMVFQNYALYPHMTVAQNIAFSLRMAGQSRSEIQGRVRTAAESLQITNLLDRKPAQLSGGQRQRVAIGRAIVREPRLFLFDEPLSNLDAELRVTMRVEIARLHKAVASTMIYVTHDQVEAMTLADRIVVLRDGQIEQVGTPEELFNNPANTFVAGFIGSPQMNFVKPDPQLLSHINSSQHATVTQIGIRPEHLFTSEVEGAVGWRDAKVDLAEYLGGKRMVHARLNDGATIVVETPAEMSPKTGDTIPLYVQPDHLHGFSADGQRAG